MGALLLRLSLFGVDNKTRRLDLGLSRPERASAPMLRLLREKLSASPESLDAEFGFEALRLDAVEIAPPVLHNTDLTPSAAPRDLEAEARLHDRLAARLGAKTIGTLRERAAHAPERASLWAHGEPPAGVMIAPPQDGVMRRPLSLFAPPQPIEAMASVPDGPPIRFRWRRVLREIARAEGPERIEADWLQAPHAQARDYYRVEDNQGRRYWIYREGLYGQGEPPRWYVHGLFA
jgi:protein ImuB